MPSRKLCYPVLIFLSKGYPSVVGGWIRYHPCAGRHPSKQTFDDAALDLHVLSFCS